jgi:hypothetical protein
VSHGLLHALDLLHDFDLGLQSRLAGHDNSAWALATSLNRPTQA